LLPHVRRIEPRRHHPHHRSTTLLPLSSYAFARALIVALIITVIVLVVVVMVEIVARWRGSGGGVEEEGVAPDVGHAEVVLARRISLERPARPRLGRVLQHARRRGQR
jgi:sterol desaturase/sphingolipid hydroxylase (fatty acid hydroxylase superfamily)